MLARLSEEKGVRYLIESVSLLKEDGVSFKLIILGDGPRRNELETLTKLQGLDNYIEFLGFQSRHRKVATGPGCFSFTLLVRRDPNGFA